MLSVQNLGKRFDHGWLFRHLEFSLEPGCHLTIRGRNGSGKSTLLRMLVGLMEPTEGAINRFNQSIGFFALDGALYGSLTVREHLEFGAAMQNVAISVDEWLERIQLSHADTRPCGKLSTGMRSRVKLALAIMASPSILVLDEPTAGLDERGRELVQDLAADQLKSGLIISATNESSDWLAPTHMMEL